MDVCHSLRRAQVRIRDSFKCEPFKGGREPLSNFIRGILTGFHSRLFNRVVGAVETRCIAK
ncbi:MAG: hypothetical protein DRJ51_03015 [Thermoprotei archaeon]|nr:MAG: hypothetical protein DRJ36_04250 [Thermoprotei archaeon]RLE81829.1 MAG: hypothetical protein DRJ51_03015 [Thermoprotei archaeon]RLF02318.1 MAG: hypothetical protein DRJ59_03955 [Thermoprotei archaeon]